MIIKFIDVQIINFMSIENATINLNDNGFVKVVGYNNSNTDNANSNGSGKSAIWESINWCITGETIRGSKDVVRHNSKEGALIKLTFSIDNDTFEITRTKNHSKFKNNLFIKKNGEDISGKGLRDSEQLLQKYFPDLTSSLINSVIILGQGLPMRFTNNSPSGRKEVLEKLLKTDFMIQDLKDRVYYRKQHLENDERNIQDNIVRIDAQKNVYNNQMESYKNQLDELNNIDIQKLIDKQSDYIKLIDELTNEINSINSTYDIELDSQYLSIQDKKSSLIDTMQKEIDNINSTYKDKLLNMQSEVLSIKSNINQLDKEIKKLESISDICPTCGQKLPDVHIVDTTELKNQLALLNEQYNNKQKLLDDINKNLNDELSNIKLSFNSKIKECDNDILNIKQLIQKKSSLEKQILNYNQEYQSLSLNITQHDDKIKQYNDMILSTNSKIANLDNDKNVALVDLENIQQHIQVQKSFETILRRDFRGILLQNCINYINKKAKEYCFKIFDNELIEFALDGNNISITYNGKEYESLSGGEKQKIDLIMQFSLRNLLCNYTDFSSNILVLDELTDNLDSLGCDKIIDFISSELVDVSSVYIISHRSDLEIPYDKTIKIIKNEEDISSVLEET